MSFGFLIKSHPTEKKSLYIHGHPNKLPPNVGDKIGLNLEFKRAFGLVQLKNIHQNTNITTYYKNTHNNVWMAE